MRIRRVLGPARLVRTAITVENITWYYVEKPILVDFISLPLIYPLFSSPFFAYHLTHSASHSRMTDHPVEIHAPPDYGSAFLPRAPYSTPRPQAAESTHCAGPPRAGRRARQRRDPQAGGLRARARVWFTDADVHT
jgi:hypothetical protein